jgi:hypothetical protein
MATNNNNNDEYFTFFIIPLGLQERYRRDVKLKRLNGGIRFTWKKLELIEKWSQEIWRRYWEIQGMETFAGVWWTCGNLEWNSRRFSRLSKWY